MGDKVHGLIVFFLFPLLLINISLEPLHVPTVIQSIVITRTRKTFPLIRSNNWKYINLWVKLFISQILPKQRHVDVIISKENEETTRLNRKCSSLQKLYSKHVTSLQTQRKAFNVQILNLFTPESNMCFAKLDRQIYGTQSQYMNVSIVHVTPPIAMLCIIIST